MSDSHSAVAGPLPQEGDYIETDPAILALLEFAAVPREREVEGGWTPKRQREFIARLAAHGSANKACEEMGKNRTGVTKLYNHPQGASFRAAWDGAVALARTRKAKRQAADPVPPGTRPPTIDHRFRTPSAQALPRRGGEGQVLNEFGEYEDEESVQRRAEAARSNIANKLLRARRLYLQEICGDEGKRAAFEILTDLPVDWDKAARLEPQADEPWRPPNMHNADMMLTAEAGWLNDVADGGTEDKKAALRKIIDKMWAGMGREPIDWGAE